MHIQEHVPLAGLTTFEIGGQARYFVEVRTDDEIREALQWAHERSISFIILAGCSNILVPDRGLDALVIKIASEQCVFDGTQITTHAGCRLLSMIEEAGKRNVGGWEKLAGIPGTVGGAVRGNAGAFGSEIKDFITSVHALNTDTGGTKTFTREECDFSYRHSFFKDNPEWIILSAVIRLRNVAADESMRRAKETITEREKRHLQNVRAAGSFFMNPEAPAEVVAMFEAEKGVRSREGRVPAGWLIEKAGMKGASVGGATASLQHPNYIVNIGGATDDDVRALAERIKDAVEKQFGVRLKEEAVVLG